MSFMHWFKISFIRLTAQCIFYIWLCIDFRIFNSLQKIYRLFFSLSEHVPEFGGSLFFIVREGGKSMNGISASWLGLSPQKGRVDLKNVSGFSSPIGC